MFALQPRSTEETTMPSKDRAPQPVEGKPKRRPAKGSPSTPPPVPAATPMAGFDFNGLNRRFMQRGGDAAHNEAQSYGARVEMLQVQPGERYWKVIGVYHLAPDENRDRHHAFIEALDESGSRLKNPNLRVCSIWEGKTDGPDRPKPLDKPDNEPAADVPLERNMTMTIWLEGDGPSERVTGLHTRHEDEVGPGGGRNSRFHHSYYLVFQRTQAAADTGDGGSVTGDVSGGVSGGESKPDAGSGGSEGDTSAQPFRFLCWPTDHLQIIQAFGANPALYAPHGFPGHEGVDIVAAENDPIYCVAPGVVKMINTPEAWAVNGHAYGAHVRVAHQDGYETIYAHFKVLHVKEGDPIVAGQVLGLADHTGNVWGNPPDHLHLTLKHAGETLPGYRNNIVDPMPFLLPLLGGAAPARPIRLGAAQVRVAQKLGLNCNAPIDAGGAITPRLAAPQLISETGVQWVRLNFIVRGFSGPDDGRWVETYRRIISGLRGQGLHIYALIGAEAHPEDPGNQFRDPPPSGPIDNAWIRGYAANVRRIVQLFGSDLAVVESFNEPNDWHRTPNDSTAWEKAWIDPGWFAVMLQAVYDAVADLPVTLVSGPLLSTQWGNDAAVYLPRVYQAGIDRFGWGKGGRPFPFDGVGFHPYVASNPGDPQAEIPAGYRQYIAEVREAIARFEPLGKPLYLSEMGWQNAEDRQGTCMEVGLACALDDPAVALCFWYGMQDDAGESYGLYRRDGLAPGHRKPIYDRFVALASSGRSVTAARPWNNQPGAVFVAELDSTPDDTVLGPQQGFTKVWQMRNSGATTWGPDYKFVLVDGPALGASPAAVPSCAPGQTVNLTLQFTTPAAEGQYTSTWSLADPQGNLFGEKVWTRVSVLAPVGIPLPTPQPGPTALSPLMAAALGMIQQTYWLRVAAAASAADAQAAIQAAGDDALRSIRELMEAK